MLVTVSTCKTVMEPGTQTKLSSGVGPMPDSQLCSDLQKALSDALTRAGYKGLTAGETSDLVAKVNVTQRARSEAEGTNFAPKHRGLVTVSIYVSVSAKDREYDKFLVDAALDDSKKVKEQLNESVEKIANDVASSPPLREAGLAPPS